MLTKDDYYELEKICDIYSGWIGENLARYCDIAMKYDGKLIIRKKEPGKRLPKNPMDDSIKELRKTQDKVKQLREKLEDIRLK